MVLHCGTGNLYGGVEKMLSWMAKSGNASRFALCFPGSLADELRSLGASVNILGEARFSRPWTIWRIRNRLKQLDADCYVFHGCWTFAALAPAIKHKRRILAIHDIPQGKHWVERLARRTRPDGIIANSRTTAFAAARLFPKVPIAIVYPPVPQFKVLPGPQRKLLRRLLCANQKDTVILIASRFDLVKGHGVLIDALIELKQRQDWVAWIVGNPQRDHELLSMLSMVQTTKHFGIDGRVRFLGHRDDVPDLMQAADIYCQPNLGPEGFGISFVEAMRAGLPVVTTGFGAALELIDDSRGILLPPGNPLIVARALEHLITSPKIRHSLGESAREWSRDRFTVEQANQGWKHLTDPDRKFHGEILTGLQG